MGSHYYYPHGTIIQGTHQGNYITAYPIGDNIGINYKGEGEYWIIDSKANFHTFSKIAYPIKWKDYSTPSWYDVYKWLEEHTIGKFSSSDIERVVDVASSQSGADPGAVVAGGLMFGAIGALAGASTTSSSATLAIYLKNKDKYLIKFRSIEYCNFFKEKMFVF